jgi:ATP-dependent RNA helicase DeaD
MDLMDRKSLDLSAIDYCILDEADEMLDMGFFDDVETILKAVKPERRVALFSATMPDAILKIVRTYIGNVEILEDAAPEEEKPAVDQFYLIVKKEDRFEVLRRIVDSSDEFYALIFCATKIGADELSHRLVENTYPAEAIHGDLSQEARDRTLRRFRSKLTTILVATDVAARGLDIERLTHVINWDMPHDKETYIHRIGRTGRAGRRGKAISLALPAERARIVHLSRLIERILGSPIVFTKVPQVKTVMKSLKRRIISSVLTILPEEDVENGAINIADVPAKISTELAASVNTENGAFNSVVSNIAALPTAPEAASATAAPISALLTDPVTAISRELIGKIGAEKAVAALITLSYGEILDISRYGPITEFQENPPQSSHQRPYASVYGGAREEGRSRHSASRHDDPHPRERSFGHRPQGRREGDVGSVTRVYVGLGRQHGASARDVAQLLSRAGDVPGRLVDAIEMKDFCSFATMPEEAARRACDFSRREKDEPTIKPALTRG